MTHADPPPAAATPTPARRRRSAAELRRSTSGIALACVALSLVAFVVALVGFRQGWLSFEAATRGLVGIAIPALAVLGVLFGLLAAILALVAKPRAGVATALVSVAVGSVIFAVWTMSDAKSVRSPPVHDVATDWTDPLTFSQKVLDARGDKANPVELAPVVPEGPGSPGGFLGRPVAMVNRDTCPGAAPVILVTPPADAYARLKAAVTAERMALLVDDPAGGRLEATVARGFWGVRDDLVGRVRAEGSGVRIDLRSIARAGLNDGGANCDRVSRIRRALAG